VTVDEVDRLRLDGKLIDYGLTGRITKIIEQGNSFAALSNFIERVSRNPDESVAEDLYRFLEKGNLPIDPDGYVLAFKKVDDAYNSFYSGASKVNYTPGTSPEMPREECDPNRSRTCSRGLHACSFEYLSFWYKNKGRLVIVRIDPEHVTAIPMDHNDQKLRCCKLEVLGEIPEEDAANHFKSAVDARYAPEPDVVEEEVLELTPAMQYPTYDLSEGGTLAGGPAVNADGSVNGWVGNEWLPVAPEHANGERLKLHVPEEDDPAAEEVPIAEWVKRGYTAGAEAGKLDKENGYTYQPDVDMPAEVSDETDIASAYTKSFIDGYDRAYRSTPLPDAED
jgi:hypothetical protein